jgi:phenylacetate-CoA ligase
LVIARGPLGSAGKLASALGAELRQLVVTPEVGLIAASCVEGRLHVPADHLLIEIVDDAGTPLPAGAMGTVCVTDLGNHAAPYLRQRLPQRGRLGARCGCGQVFPMLELE